MKLSDSKISTKLSVAIAVIVLISTAITAAISFVYVNNAFEAAAFEKLMAAQKDRSSELKIYLDSIKQDIRVMAANHMVIDAFTELEDAYDSLGAGAMTALQKLYIDDNPNPIGEKHRLDAAPDGSAYSTAHRKYHPWFLKLLEERGYHDIFLVDHAGEVLYSVFKERDLATNLVSGKWRNTDLSKVFQLVRENRQPDLVVVTDIAPFPPSNNQPAGFFGVPLFEHGGDFLGVLIFQMPIGRINELMRRTSSMGETGETYIVGKDHLMRSDSRFSKETTILKAKIDTEMVRRALAGETDVGFGLNNRGTEVVSAFGPMTFNGVTWGILAEQDHEEVDRAVDEMGIWIFATGVVIVLLVAGAGVFFGRNFTRPINALVAGTREMSAGNLGARVEVNGGDEVGQLGQSFNDMASSMGEVAGNIRETTGKVSTTLAEISGAVASQSSGASEQASAVNETISTLEEISSTSGQTMEKAEALGGIADRTRQEGEQGLTMIGQVIESMKVIRDKVEAIAEMNLALSEQTKQIGQITGAVANLAQQSKMLALNASIEAAKAGESGKGFAVVAGQIGRLAEQSEESTVQVQKILEDIQHATDRAVMATEEGTKEVDQGVAVVKQTGESLESLSIVIDDAGTASQQIVAAVRQEVAGIEQISKAMDDINKVTGQFVSASEQTKHATEDLGVVVGELASSVEAYKI